jgi:hypothetical protein
MKVLGRTIVLNLEHDEATELANAVDSMICDKGQDYPFLAEIVRQINICLNYERTVQNEEEV